VGEALVSAAPVVELEDYVTVPEIAEAAEVDQSTVRRWIRERRLPATKVARSWIVKRTDADEFLKEWAAAQQEPQ
jgi:excisionase family DNA binding protein